jgi:thiamine biosynthesis lipoprotein
VPPHTDIGRRLATAVLCVLAAAFALVWWHRFRSPVEAVTIRREPIGVMGTSSQIVAVVPGRLRAEGDEMLAVAEGELRRAEAIFSTWIDRSELSRFNAAPPGVAVHLSRDLAELLAWSKEMHRRTGGAFDVTAGPLVDCWRRAADRGRLPYPDELARARDSSSWDDFEIFTVTPLGIRRRETAALDVDGIAKGYAIDLAVDALMRAGAVGAMIEVGGDLRAVGVPPNGDHWPVGVRSPFADELLATIPLERGAVCTSGGYARPLEIDGESFSHIVDPRSGMTAREAASVTVIAGEASQADAWATALAILGPRGLELVGKDPDVEALLILGPPEAPEALATAGFPELTGIHDLVIERTR